MNKLLDLKEILSIKTFDGAGIILSFTVLRFIACCLITNTHYNNVYPSESFAVGGLMGDFLFFIISGFVLSKPTQEGFISWYWKRIVRIYPAIIFGVFLYIFTGYQTIEGGVRNV